MKTPLLIPLLLAGCTVKPAVIPRKDGQQPIVWLGGSLMKKADREVASAELPDGTKLYHETVNSDETGVATAYIGKELVIGAAREANVGEAIREGEATERIISNDGVKMKKIESDTTIKTFVPPETPP